MATKTFYATRDMKNPTSYGTRMLRAGDPVELDGPKARLYRALGAITEAKPKAAAPEEKPLEAMTKAELVSLANVPEKDAKKYTKAQLIDKIQSK